MSTRTAPEPWAPGVPWWVLLATLITLGIVGNWVVSAAVLVIVVLQLVRPFDFLIAFLLLAGGATFVDNTGGWLTVQLGVLTGGILLMLVCYAVSNRGRVLSIPRAPMTWPVLCFVALSLANAGRGLLAGYSPRYIGLELIPLLGLGTAILVASAFDRARHLSWAVVGLFLIGWAAAIRGIHVFEATRVHGAGYTAAAPGLAGVLAINLALRSRSSWAAIGLVLLSVPMFLQQFVTFGRGLWSGCIAALIASVLVYGGLGRGGGQRWTRAALTVGTLVGAALVGVLILAYLFDEAELLAAAATRMQSSLGTDLGYESRSNLIRVAEYLFVWDLIRESPWVGHGVGYAFTMKQIISLDLGEQWYAHQNYLFVWLKQGLVGLGLFVWLLWSAMVVGFREARRRMDPVESAWFASSGAATLFLAVLSLSNFPFGVVNEMFLLALLWGGSMAMTRRGAVLFRWSPPPRSKGNGPG